jgi:hypothetical protein
MFSNVKFVIKRTDTEEDEIDTKHSLNKVLANPNKLQTWKQLLYMVYMYKICCGAAFMLPGFGINKKPSSLSFISFLDFETFDKIINHSSKPYANEDVDNIITHIDFFFKYTQAARFKVSDLMWLRDGNVNAIDDYSRIESLKPQALNIHKALTARGIMMDKKGGIGMISGNQKDSGQSVPLIPKERKRLQKAAGNYGLGEGKNPIIVTDVPLRYTSFVYPTRELMLFEEIDEDFHVCCDRLGINRELFDGKTTFSNKKMAETSTYTNTILPAWTDFFTLLNFKLNTHLENIRIDPEFSHVEALQDNELDKATVEKTKSETYRAEVNAGLISSDEYRQQMGYVVQPKTVVEESTEEAPASTEEQAALRGSVGGVQGILSVQASVAAGTTTREAALSILTIIYGFTEEQAEALLGEPQEEIDENQDS